ncbi:MAG: SLC13 family permease [Sneathiella sp.]
MSFNQTLKILMIVGIAVSLGVALSFTLTSQMAGVAALTVLCIGFWATGVVPEFWTALVFFLVAMVTELAPAKTIFSGFHSSTFWLLFSGIVLGAAIRHTGLGKRTAALLAQVLGGQYRGVIIGTTLFSLALAFILPSSAGRIVMLVPILVSLADHMGYGPTSKGRTGLLSAAVLGTNIPAFSILPANAPNMIMAGMAENLFGYQVAYWDYLLAHFPVLGLLKALCLVLLILWMFPDHAPNQPADAEAKVPPLSGNEWKLILYLGLCLVFWISDGIHGVFPGWVALAAALYCLWPGHHDPNCAGCG